MPCSWAASGLKDQIRSCIGPGSVTHRYTEPPRRLYSFLRALVSKPSAFAPARPMHTEARRSSQLVVTICARVEVGVQNGVVPARQRSVRQRGGKKGVRKCQPPRNCRRAGAHDKIPPPPFFQPLLEHSHEVELLVLAPSLARSRPGTPEWVRARCAPKARGEGPA